MSGHSSGPHRRPIAIAIALALAVAAARAAGQEVPLADPPKSEAPALEPRPPAELPASPLPTDEPFGVPVYGSLSLRYLYRHTSNDTDQDLYGFLGVDVGDPSRQEVTGHVLTKAAWDLDGNTNATGASSFDTLEDTYDSRLTAQLYEAYADWHGSDSLEVARLGRQLLSETPVETYFDGLRLDSTAHSPKAWKLGGYAGVPSHLYESSPEGDLIFGAFGEARPLTSTRARLDWMQVQDNYLGSDRLDSVIRLAVWQQVSESVALYGSGSFLNWKGRDLELRGTWMQLDGDAQVEISYYELLSTQRAETIEFDPYFDIAGEYNPYRELRASASRGFGDHMSLAVGADVRRLVDDSDEGDFNHDYERWYVAPAVIDWPITGMTTTVTGELWDANDEVTSTLDAGIEQEFTEDTKGRVGTSYSLYKYDYLTMSERDHVRSWYIGVETRATKQVRLRLDYVLESDPFDRYQTLRATATWSF